MWGIVTPLFSIYTSNVAYMSGIAGTECIINSIKDGIILEIQILDFLKTLKWTL